MDRSEPGGVADLLLGQAEREGRADRAIGHAAPVADFEQHRGNARPRRFAAERGEAIGQGHPLDLLVGNHRGGEPRMRDGQAHQRGLLERAHCTVAQRRDRRGRFAINQARDRQHVAGEHEAQDLPAAIVEQHIAHHRARAQDEHLSGGIVLADQDRAALEVALALLQPAERVALHRAQLDQVAESLGEAA